MIAVGSAILAWDWGRLVRQKTRDTGFFIHAASTIVACVLAATGAGWTALLILGAGACTAALATSGLQSRAWSALGVLYLGLPGLILVWFRSDQAYGVTAIFFFFLVVWSADIAAYFTGRTLGGPKLAPRISPGKTWSGFAGGLIIPTLLSFGYALWLGGTSAVTLALTGAALALSSQFGDLAESAIKRNFHVKDAGQLLPGHGGLLDRVDGLIGAALAAGVIVNFRDFLNAGKALLIWP
jgi:phosphatidate cytidylyltransferase